jgi:tripartite-type tricarboxylate transporter receptor subunit TctC
MYSAIRMMLAAALLPLVPFAALAQAWPAKTVRIIAPFPPGGSVDQVSRILAAQLTTQIGQQVIVENRSGASGSIGTQAVATAAPDGYTIGVVFDTHAVNPTLIPNIPVRHAEGPGAGDADRHFAHGDRHARRAAVPGFPRAARRGEEGAGRVRLHRDREPGPSRDAQVSNITGAQFTHIPYKGGGPLMTDAIGGQVPVAIGTVFLANPHVKGGR